MDDLFLKNKAFICPCKCILFFRSQAFNIMLVSEYVILVHSKNYMVYGEIQSNDSLVAMIQ